MLVGCMTIRVGESWQRSKGGDAVGGGGGTWKGGRQGWDTPQEDLEVDLSQAALRQAEGK